jgi:hypothetical protein
MDYQDSLVDCNIYINCDNPPVKLLDRAMGIISRSRESPEMDDAAVQKLSDTSRRVAHEAEDVIVQKLGPYIIPAMIMPPDRRLASNSNQSWFNSVPVPLDPSVLTNPLPLPKPKPDLAFGYSAAAFTNNQRTTINLLVDYQSGNSYAAPDKKLRFPFLDVEFKSQAKNGSLLIATNQAAGAGAIALNGNVELMQRAFGTESFNPEELLFFSLAIDHATVVINVHWLKAPVEGEQYSFYVETLAQHYLRDVKGIQAVTRAIKNILDYGAGTRLQTLCGALDAYQEKVIRDREAANLLQEHGVSRGQ